MAHAPEGAQWVGCGWFMRGCGMCDAIEGGAAPIAKRSPPCPAPPPQAVGGFVGGFGGLVIGWEERESRRYLHYTKVIWLHPTHATLKGNFGWVGGERGNELTGLNSNGGIVRESLAL